MPRQRPQGGNREKTLAEPQRTGDGRLLQSPQGGGPQELLQKGFFPLLSPLRPFLAPRPEPPGSPPHHRFACGLVPPRQQGGLLVDGRYRRGEKHLLCPRHGHPLVRALQDALLLIRRRGFPHSQRRKAVFLFQGPLRGGRIRHLRLRTQGRRPLGRTTEPGLPLFLALRRFPVHQLPRRALQHLREQSRLRGRQRERVCA